MFKQFIVVEHQNHIELKLKDTELKVKYSDSGYYSGWQLADE
jgi:hypothetical protein